MADYHSITTQRKILNFLHFTVDSNQRFWVFVFENLRNTAESFKQIPSQFFQNSKVKTMGKSNFWRNILISSDFMRYLALQSIVQFSKLLTHITKRGRKVMWIWRGMKLWMLLQKLFYPMLNISRKRNFLLMFFTNPLGWGVRDGERIRMVFNGPPSIYIQSP